MWRGNPNMTPAQRTVLTRSLFLISCLSGVWALLVGANTCSHYVDPIKHLSEDLGFLVPVIVAILSMVVRFYIRAGANGS
jgi:hypothetical protein